MEWLFEIIDKLVQSAIWKTVLSQFEWVDWFTLALVIVGILYGAKRGLIREIVEILEMLLLLFIVYTFKEFLSGYLFTKVGLTKQLSEPVAFLALTLPVWWVIHWIDHQFSKSFHTKLTGTIRVPGGMILGFAHILILWSFMSQIIIGIPIKSVQKVYQGKNSMTGPFVAQLAPTVYVAMTQPASLFKEKKSS